MGFSFPQSFDKITNAIIIYKDFGLVIISTLPLKILINNIKS